MNTINKCVVKISVSSETNYTHIDDVVYYRSGLSPDFITRWLWYFEYLAALVKVNNPHRKVEFFKGPQDVLLGKEWHEHRRNAILKSRLTKLKELEKGVVDDDLFHFKRQDNEAEKRRVLSQIDDLEKDKYPIDEFPENINKIKNYIRI